MSHDAHAHAEPVDRSKLSPQFHVAHHFDSADTQFDSQRMGIWIFLVTEILFFGGMFCAFAVFRTWYFDGFKEAHHHLDKVMGGTNTLVLICSSLTMALGVRSAQQSRKGLTCAMLALTLIFAGTFLVIKYFEYRHKFADGLLPGAAFGHPWGGNTPEGILKAVRLVILIAAAPLLAITVTLFVRRGPTALAKTMAVLVGFFAVAFALAQYGIMVTGGAPVAAEAVHSLGNPDQGIFFAVYFMMTGVHGLHVIIGMGLIVWILVRASEGEFSSRYYSPVEGVGLYWHLVDLIWIYLFPLLYLVG